MKQPIPARIVAGEHTRYNTTTLCQKPTNMRTEASVQNLGDPQFVNASGLNGLRTMERDVDDGRDRVEGV